MTPKPGKASCLVVSHLVGVNNAIASMLDSRRLGHGRGGVFWRTQSADKSSAMMVSAQKVLHKMAGLRCVGDTPAADSRRAPRQVGARRDA